MAVTSGNNNKLEMAGITTTVDIHLQPPEPALETFPVSKSYAFQQAATVKND
jgi:hypothetical protein